MEPKSKVDCKEVEGNTKVERQNGSFIQAIVFVFMIIGGIAAFHQYRFAALEKAVDDLRHSKDSISNSMHQAQLGINDKIEARLHEHEANEHVKTVEKIAKIEERFTEVETQFREAARYRQLQIDNLLTRFNVLDEDQKRKFDTWIPSIVRLEERSKELKP